MSSPVTEIVHFRVTVHVLRNSDHWLARTLETTIFAHGETPYEAEQNAGDANVLIIQELKLQGREALVAFMEKYGIEYSIGANLGPDSSHNERLKRAA